MAARKGLSAITNNTLQLWYRVNEKYGKHKYTLGVNGLDQVVLCRGYGEDIAVGTRQVNAKLRELLKEEA